MPVADHGFPPRKLNQLFASLSDHQDLAIAVSGGGDSIALLRLVLDWRGTPRSLTSLTVNHRLREGAAAEAMRVKNWCKALGIAHHTLPWKHDGVKSGLQARARTARYDLMSAWCMKNGVSLLLTAHTADDQAETVAMRKQRTSSIKSLAGIWPQSEWHGVKVARPLLSVSREDLRAYLRGIGQRWIEDPSNDDTRFERVRIRKSHPPIQLAVEAATAQAEIVKIKARASAWTKARVTFEPSGMMRFSGQAFATLDDSARDEALMQLIAAAGGQTPERARRLQLARWLSAAGQGRKTLGGALFAKRKREVLVAREPARIDAKPVRVTGKDAVLWDGRFLVQAPRGSIIVSKLVYKQLKRKPEIPAFVDQGLPLVVKGGAVLADPFSSNHPAAFIKFNAK